jgi:hypothetical protein
MAGAQPRISCRTLLKQVEIQLGSSQCILPLMSFIISMQDIFQTNSPIHSIYTRNKHFLHKPVAILSCFQKSTFSAATQIFSSLPSNVKILKNDKAKLKADLRKYVFYTLLWLCRWIFYVFRFVILSLWNVCQVCTVNLYICVFMTCSTSCRVYDTHMHPWTVCVSVCM